MENETIEAVPSADNGNIPVDAPSEPTQDPVTPAATEPVTPTEPATPELYELPDGRKVDGATVASEYKNLLSDYTRKSQELALKTTPGNVPLQETKPTDPLTDPNYVPQTFAEIRDAGAREALRILDEREQAKVNHQQAIETAVETQLKEIKATDSTLNENLLFQHATKYGFRDLKLAHQNMKDMADMAKKVQTTTAQNIQKRNDPVSVSPGATGARPDPRQFSSARDFVKALNQSS